MLRRGAAKKITVYVNEDARHHHGPLWEAILDYLLHKGVAGATATRAIAGFGQHRVIHTPKIEALSEHLPVRIEFVETPEKADEVLPTLYEMVNDGLIEVQDTNVVKTTEKPPPAAPDAPRREVRGAARLMRIYLGEADQWKGEPLYQAIVKRLRMMDIAGATVYRGILGYGARGRTRREKRLGLSSDLPVMIAVVDTKEKLDAALPEIEAMLEGGLIVFSDVETIRLAPSQPPFPEAPHGDQA